MKSSQPLDPWLGQSIGDRQRYRLKKLIAQGGMGDVYLAMDTLLGQPVALKLLNNRLAAGELRERFEREVAVIAALRSEHIVHVSDYGVTPEGYPFYVMEFLRGQTLGRLMHKKGRLSIERTIAIITQVCLGLYPAHQGVNLWRDGATLSEHVKVIHRDLKPDNIFLVPTALGEFVKILDFGIAKIQSDRMGQTNLTDVFLGTYRYASPEQLENEKTLDERADIYSLGVILYEMLSGTNPFGSDKPYQSEPQLSGVGWAVAHLTKSPRSLREQPGCENLPIPLDQVVMRCLEKLPEHRFSSVIELSQALHAAVPGISNLQLIPSEPAAANLEDAPTPPPALTVKSPSSQAPHNSDIQADADSNVTGPNTVACETAAAKELALPRQTILLLAGAGILGSLVLLAFIIYLLRSPPFFGLNQENSVVQNPDSPQPSQQVQSSTAPPPQPVEVASFAGHTDTVWAVTVSPDAQTIVSGGYDKTIRFWNLQGNLLQTLYGHLDAVRSIALSADGKLLASSSGDKTIRLWDFQNRTLRRTLMGHAGPVWAVAISPDSKTLASGSYDGTIKIWDTQTGKLLRSLPEHYDSVWSVAISPDGQTLASAGYDGKIKIWRLQTGKLLRTLSGHSDGVRSIAISSDGQILASASWDKTVKIWNLQTGALLHTLTGHQDRVLSVAISPAAHLLASGSADRTIKIWDLQTGVLLHTLAGHSDWVVAVAFAPQANLNKSGEQTLVSGSKDKTIKVWQWSGSSSDGVTKP